MEGRYILMEITRGKIQSAKKVVVYGPEGIGKSTFASQFPDPLFIDTEGSTKDLDVARAPQISSLVYAKHWSLIPLTGRNSIVFSRFAISIKSGELRTLAMEMVMFM